ncbi:MAG TPA: type II toxin-antitoxin system RelE/ParE family toxin [Pyrinomonadaceae bacterium]|nr:type II toxin-antitoxin system RelE/ParE family toxin [Pyrinomonadaceae bacterium]
MKHYRSEAEASVEFDIESAFGWYQAEEPGLGSAFLEQLRLIYRRISENPNGYEEQRSGIRRGLMRQFPYAVYFSVEDETILILAVLHTARAPAKWQLRTY